MSRLSLFGNKPALILLLALISVLAILGCDDGGSGLTSGDSDTSSETDVDSGPLPGECQDNGDCVNCQFCNVNSICENVPNCGEGTGTECETNDQCESTQYCASNNRCKTLSPSTNCEDRHLVSSVGSELNFGYVMLGREIERPIIISNEGSCHLTVRETSFAIPESDSEFTLTELPSFPIIVEPGGSFAFKVIYKGLNPTGDRKSKLLQIASNDPETPVYRITVIVDIGGTTNLDVRYCTGEEIVDRKINMGNTSPGLAGCGVPGNL